MEEGEEGVGGVSFVGGAVTIPNVMFSNFRRARGEGQPRQAHGLIGGAAARPGDARDGEAYVCVQRTPRALRHRARHRFTHRAVFQQRGVRHAE